MSAFPNEPNTNPQIHLASKLAGYTNRARMHAEVFAHCSNMEKQDDGSGVEIELQA